MIKNWMRRLTTQNNRRRSYRPIPVEALEERLVMSAISPADAAKFASAVAAFNANKAANSQPAASFSGANNAYRDSSNDCPPTISISDARVVEGNCGDSEACFQVRLSKPSCNTVTVIVNTRDGTACSPSDYCPIRCTTLVFCPGETCKSVTVKVHGDYCYERNETFYVNLSCAQNATIADCSGKGTIVNDDRCPPPPCYNSDKLLAG